MKKNFFLLLCAAMTMAGCQKSNTSNGELRPFDVQQEFAVPQISRYMGTHSGRDGDKAEALGLHVAYTEILARS